MTEPTFTSLSGTSLKAPFIISDPAVIGVGGPGRLEVFARGADNGLWHIREPEPGTFLPWSSLGGVGTVVGTPAVGLNANGRLQVFWRGADSSLMSVVQLQANTAAWSSPAPLLVGEVLTSDPVVARDSKGRLAVFFLGLKNEIRHIHQAAPNDPFSASSGLGSISRNKLAVATNQDDRFEIFFVANENVMWHFWQVAPFSNNPNDSGSWLREDIWEPGIEVAGDPAVVMNKDGRLEVFALGFDGKVYHAWQNTPGSGPWSDWQLLPTGASVSSPTAIVDRASAIHVYTVSELNTIFLTSRGLGDWPAPEPQGSALGDPWSGKVIPVLPDPNGLVRIFIRGVNNDIQFADVTPSVAEPAV
jgi:hypothetical protein